MDLKEYSNMEQFVNEIAENEDMSHSWKNFCGIPRASYEYCRCRKNFMVKTKYDSCTLSFEKRMSDG